MVMSPVTRAGMADDDELSVAMNIRVTKADKARLDALAKRTPLTVSQLARAALRLGLAAIEADPIAALFPSAQG